LKLKKLLSKKFSKKIVDLVPTSFDVVGDIFIFNDFPEELVHMEKKIGSEILKNMNNIRVVCKKIKKYSGKFRLPILRIIAGNRRKETIHTENGIKLKLHVQNVYFSARSSNERIRINNLVKSDERVLVMFSGVSPFVVNLCKNSSAKEVYGVEINPIAHKYALENVSLNKIKNANLYLGDVRRVLPKIKKTFDRIVMPLPKSAETFLDIASFKIKKKGIIHLYLFWEEEKINKKYAAGFLKEYMSKKFKVKDIVKCGQFGPGIYRVCVDIQVLG